MILLEVTERKLKKVSECYNCYHDVCIYIYIYCGVRFM